MNGQTGEQLRTGPGQILIDAREALGITRVQAADILNLSVERIRALEENDADQLPDVVYVNGYIRSYAKLLDLAAQPLIDAWSAQYAPVSGDQKAAEASDLSRVSQDANDAPLKMGRWLVVSLLLAAGFVYFVSSNESSPKQAVVEADALAEAVIKEVAIEAVPTEEVPIEEVPIEEVPTKEGAIDALVAETLVGGGPAKENQGVALASPLQAKNVDPIGQQSQSSENPLEIPVPDTTVAENSLDPPIQELSKRPEIEGAVPEPVVVEDLEPLEAKADAMVSNSEEPDSYLASDANTADRRQNEATVEPEVAANETAAEIEPDSQEEVVRETASAFALPRLTEFGDNTIDLSFSSDCWFEIRNEAGELLYADLGRDGQSRRYFGEGPFRVKLGYSPGAMLSYNFEPIDLEPFSRRDVANLLIGETPSAPVSMTEPESLQDGI